jgi:hypothetical protein
VSISKSVTQNASIQNRLFERNLTISFMESVAEDYIPLVYDDFYYLALDEGFNVEGQRHVFEAKVMEILAILDSQDFLNCTLQPVVKVGGFTSFEYTIECHPPATEYTYEIIFLIEHTSGKGNNKLYSITHEFLSYETL